MKAAHSASAAAVTTTLGNYANTTVTMGASTTVTPTGYAVQSQGTYAGTISVNASGVVSVSNAAPPGTYTVTIRATDNCGATTDAPFTLTVGCVTTLTVNNIGDGADSAPGNGVCTTSSSSRRTRSCRTRSWWV